MIVPLVDKFGLRKFGLIFALFVSFVFGLTLPYLRGNALPYWPWAVSGVLLFLSLIVPAALKPLYILWMSMGHYMGILNTKIILCLIYYLVFTPIALVFRLADKDPMERNWKTNEISYWKDSRQQPAKHMENIY